MNWNKNQFIFYLFLFYTHGWILMGEDGRTNIGTFGEQGHPLLLQNFSYGVASFAFETFSKSVGKISEVGVFSNELYCTLRGGHIVVGIVHILVEGLVKYYFYYILLYLI